MTFRSPLIFRRMLVAAALCATSAAQAYFIRPYVQLDAVVKDGLTENGATQAGVDIDTLDIASASASVDLSTGQTRNYLKVGLEQFAQSAGVMGDRLNFFGGPSTVDFSFDFDGRITTDAAAAGSETLQIGVFANFRVFDAAAGATSSNWTSLSGALASDTRSLSFNSPASELDEFVQQTLAGSFAFLGGSQTVDVFASLSIFSAVNDNDVVVTMDFLNTGTFGVQAGRGVSFSSESGVFPGSVPTPPVPEPSSYALMTAGLAMLLWTLSRRRSRKVISNA